MADHLLREERIPPGTGRNEPRDLRLDAASRQEAGDEPGERLVAERREANENPRRKRGVLRPRRRGRLRRSLERDEQQRGAVGVSGQVEQELPRGRVGPLKVLQNDDAGGPVPQDQRLEGAPEPLRPSRFVELRRSLVGDPPPEGLTNQLRVLRMFRHETEHGFRERPPPRLGGVPSPEPEAPVDDASPGTERHLLRVFECLAGENEKPLRRSRGDLLEEPALPDSPLPFDREPASAPLPGGLGGSEGCRQLLLAADDRRELPRAAPGGPFSDGGVDADRGALSLHPDRREALELDGRLRLPEGRVGTENLPFGGRLHEPRREVHRVPHHRVLAPPVAPHVAAEDRAGVDADLLPRHEGGARIAQGEGREDPAESSSSWDSGAPKMR